MPAAIEGTYTLDGMLQGKIPESAHATMSENLTAWSKSATQSGFPISLEMQGSQFSLLCGTTPQKITMEGIAVAETLTESLNVLIESFPPEGRTQLFSTIRSSEFVKGAEIQGLYMIGANGLIRAQTRRVEMETVAPDKPLSRRDKLKMGGIAFGILAVFLVASSFVIDFKKMFSGVQGRFTVLKIEDIKIDSSLYEKYVIAEPVKLDRREGGMWLKISRGPEWESIKGPHLPVTEQGISWDDLLVLSNLKRGYIPCLMTGSEAGTILEGKIPVTALKEIGEAPVLLRLPGNSRISKIEMAR